MPTHAPFWWGFLGHIPPKNVAHRPNPKKDRPWAEPRHLSHLQWISAARFELSVWRRKKDSTGQDRTGKSHEGLYFTYLGRSSHWSDLHQKLCSSWPCRRNDVCQVSKWNFQGLPFYRGRIFHCPIDFWLGLTTVQRCCSACDQRLSILCLNSHVSDCAADSFLAVSTPCILVPLFPFPLFHVSLFQQTYM